MGSAKQQAQGPQQLYSHMPMQEPKTRKETMNDPDDHPLNIESQKNSLRVE
jgi:hypothetical protein